MSAGGPWAGWGELPAPAVEDGDRRGRGRVATFVRTAVPGLVIAAVLVLLDRPVAAAVLAVVATAVAVGSARSARFHRGVQRALAAVGRAVGHALTFVLLGLVELVVFLPLSVVARVVRVDPLRYGHAPRRGWAGAPGAASDATARRPYAVDPEPPPTGARRVARAVPRIAGWVVLVLALDLALGVVGQAVLGGGDEARPAVPSAQARAATRDAPWVDAYLDELEQVSVEFEPFVQTDVSDFAGRYVNVEDGERRSYVPEHDEGLPVVLLFGGTSAWGEGQRDERTVASELARLAEADGHPVRVRNLAQRGDVNFAAVLRFERALAAAEEPAALAIFADGPDDLAVQRQTPSADPGQYDVEAARVAVVEDDRTLWERYQHLSLVHRAVSRVQALFAIEPAAAASPSGAGGPVSLGDRVADTAAVYERGRLLAEDLAAGSGVPVRFFWLPYQQGSRAGDQYREVAATLDPSVGDLSGLLDGVDEPVFLDDARVNERGARLVAEAIYEAVRPQLVALDRGR